MIVLRSYLLATAAYNRAAQWARYGRPAPGPAPGVIVVWTHHVAKALAERLDLGPRVWDMISGNDGHRVRERPRSVRGAIAFRWPT